MNGCDTICYGLYGSEVRESCRDCGAPYGATVESVVNEMYFTVVEGRDMPHFTAYELQGHLMVSVAFGAAYQQWAKDVYAPSKRPCLAKIDHAADWTLENVKMGIPKGSALARPVVSVNKLGKEVVYTTITNAARITGAQRSQISRCCNGSAKTAKGYIWKWAVT